jgi:hypothetical protein
MLEVKEQIHVIDNQVTVEEIIKDIVKTKVIITYFVYCNDNFTILILIFFLF